VSITIENAVYIAYFQAGLKCEYASYLIFNSFMAKMKLNGYG